MNTSIINISEIEALYQDFCKENKMEFSEEEFEDFLKFLEIDFYDWVKANIKQFHIKK